MCILVKHLLPLLWLVTLFPFKIWKPLLRAKFHFFLTTLSAKSLFHTFFPNSNLFNLLLLKEEVIPVTCSNLPLIWDMWMRSPRWGIEIIHIINEAQTVYKYPTLLAKDLDMFWLYFLKSIISLFYPCEILLQLSTPSISILGKKQDHMFGWVLSSPLLSRSQGVILFWFIIYIIFFGPEYVSSMLCKEFL